MPLCDSLVEHSVEHFAHEEHWFDTLSYPRAVQHRLMHEKLKLRLADFREKLAARTDPGVEDLARFTDWLAHHITGEDRAYGAWLNGQGVY